MTMLKVALPTGPVIACEDSGGPGLPIIFSHGLFMNHSMFDPQVTAFSDEYRCITWDERAHGQTEHAGAFTYWDSARDLLALMDALGIERAVHVGMSQGGLLGMRAALLAPERFIGIVQLATQARGLDEEAAGAFGAMIQDWIDNGPKPEALDFLADFILGPDIDKTYWQHYWRGLTPARIGDAVSALFSIDSLYDRLHDVAVPLYTIHGDADVATSHLLAEHVIANVPDPRGYTLIAGGTHAVNLGYPDQVNAAIASFVNDLAHQESLIHG